MNNFSNDSHILSLQHQLDVAKRHRREAEDENWSEDLILYYMNCEDQISEELIRLGCHPRDLQ